MPRWGCATPGQAGDGSSWPPARPLSPSSPVAARPARRPSSALAPRSVPRDSLTDPPSEVSGVAHGLETSSLGSPHAGGRPTSLQARFATSSLAGRRCAPLARRNTVCPRPQALSLLARRAACRRKRPRRPSCRSSGRPIAAPRPRAVTRASRLRLQRRPATCSSAHRPGSVPPPAPTLATICAGKRAWATCACGVAGESSHGRRVLTSLISGAHPPFTPVGCTCTRISSPSARPPRPHVRSQGTHARRRPKKKALSDH